VILLPPDTVHLYWLRCQAAPPDECLRLLSEEERERYHRFRFDKDRDLFLSAHAAKRLLLARYTGTPPEQLQFACNAYGKPYLPGNDAPVFNLSHTRGFVAVAIAGPSFELGVDTEDSQRGGNWRDLITRVFTPGEQEQILHCLQADPQARFFELWTLKEAYSKAKGLGLSLPLQSFSFQLDGDRIELQTKDDAAGWQFELHPNGVFRIALAARNQKRTPWRSKLREMSLLLDL
jgi:4'-phosphopantetheinyl transferase